MAKKVKEEDPDQELLQRIRDRRRLVEDAETWRQECLEDLTFCDPKRQWPDNIRREREADGRPCLTVDRIGAFWHQLVNDFRQNRQSIRVLPVGDGADQKNAEIRQGLIRHIEYDSNADIAYDQAFEGQGLPGFGFVRVLTEYESPDSFNQVIKIGSIQNQFMVHLDPASVLPDGSDANWAFIEEDFTKEAFEDEFPDAKLSTPGNREWDSIGNTAPGWITKDGVRVSEYYERTRERFKLYKLPDGSTTEEKPEGEAESRDSYRYVVKWYKTNGLEILDRTDWPSDFIPVVPFYGETLLIDGRITHAGLIRRSKDPATLYNLMKTAQAEAIALTPKAPFIGAAEAFEGYEKEWANANRTNMAYLPYRHIDGRGNPIPTPQRQFAEANIAAITAAMEGSESDLKASAGMYDANLGNREAGQSGVAIRSLAAQGQTGNFHFQDNFNRSLRHVGRIIDGLLGKVYTGPQIRRIIKEDDSNTMVGINGEKVDGQEQDYNLAEGRYDVIVTAGPSYASKRSENLKLMLELAKVIPGFAQAGGDLIVSQMDTPIARQIQERLKKSLPPQFQDKKPGQVEIPPEIQQKIGQYEQMIDQMTHALNSAHDAIDQKTLELDTKRDVALIQQKTELLKALATIEGRAAQTMLEAEIASAQATIDATFGAPTAPGQEAQPQGQPVESQEPPVDETQAPEQPMDETQEPMEPVEVPPTPEEVQSAAMLEALQNQNVAMAAIAEALAKLSAPKRLITDRNGRPVGVETVSNG